MREINLHTYYNFETIFHNKAIRVCIILSNLIQLLFVSKISQNLSSSHKIYNR